METENEYRTMEAYCIVKRLCYEEGDTDHVPMAVLLDCELAFELAEKWNRNSIDNFFDVRGVSLVWSQSSLAHIMERLFRL